MSAAAAAHPVVIGGMRPVFAAIVGAIDAAQFFERLDNRVDAIWVRGRNTHADAAQHSGVVAALEREEQQ